MQDPQSVKEPQQRTAELRTFMFADIRGYTRFSLERGDEAAAQLVKRFASLARESVTARDGEVIELRGDEILAVFRSARQALRAAVDLQVLCSKSSLEDPTLPLPVGVGLDAGEAMPLEEGFKGRALNLASRLSGLAGAGEVLATQEVAHLAGKMDGLAYANRGTAQLKGFASPTRVVEVLPEEKANTPPRADLGPLGAQDLRLPIGGFLGALPEGVIVGREVEIGRILGAVDAVAGGSGRLLMLGGEPGVGKTRIAQEITLRVRNLGFLVAAGRCYESHRAVPFYPFLEALATAYEGAPSSIKRDVPRRWPYLERLLSNETESPLIISSDSQDEQQRLFRAVTGFIQAAASEVPVAVLLDDLQWADASSLELLQQLARHTRSYCVLLLGTYRDVEVTDRHPLEGALRDLNREHLVELLKVDRLQEQGTAALVAAALGDAKVEPEITSLLHSHSEGNPFFIHELVRALVERGDLYRKNGHWEGRGEEIVVPASVRSAIIERLSRLTDRTQQLLLDASVLGQQFTFDHLRALTQESETEVEKALEEALASGLIRETGSDTYAFGHALGQQALYADLTGRRRRRLHLAAAEALERLPEGARESRVAELAWHFLRGEDQERAFSYAILAGDRAETIFAHPEAEIHYRTALRLARRLAESDQGAQDTTREVLALEKLGGLLLRVGHYEEALDALVQAASIYESTNDLESEARVTAQFASLHHARGTVDEGLSRVLSMIRRLESMDAPHQDSAAAARLYISLSWLKSLGVTNPESLIASERAVQIARSIHDDPLLVEAQALRSDLLRKLGRRTEALQVLEEIIPIAEACQDLDALFLAMDVIAETHMMGGEFTLCRDYRQRAFDVVEKLGDPVKVAFEAGGLGEVMLRLGDWENARHYLQRGIEIMASLPSSWISGSSSWVAGVARVRLAVYHLGVGDWESARSCIEEGLAAGEQTNHQFLLTVANGLMAELELLENHPAKARNRLQPLIAEAQSGQSQVSYLVPLLALAHLQLGDYDRCADLLASSMKLNRESNNRPVLADAMHVRGRLLGKQGRWPEARESFETALSLARAMPFPQAEAKFLYEYGLMQQLAGEADEAGANLSAALVIFQKLGARRDVDQTENALSSL